MAPDRAQAPLRPQGEVTLNGANTPLLAINSGLNVLSDAAVILDSSLGSVSTVQRQTWSNASSTMFTVNSGVTLRTGSARTLTFNAGSAGIVVNGVMSGGSTSGGFVVNNFNAASGVVTLSETNTFVSPTTVTGGGTLSVNGALTGTPRVIVEDAGTLGGSSSIAKPVTVAAGGTLRGGTGATGTNLSLAGNLELQDGSIVILTVGENSAHSTLTRLGSGNWTFDSDQAFLFDDDGVSDGATYESIVTGLAEDPGTLGAWQILNSGWEGNDVR